MGNKVNEKLLPYTASVNKMPARKPKPKRSMKPVKEPKHPSGWIN